MNVKETAVAALAIAASMLLSPANAATFKAIAGGASLVMAGKIVEGDVNAFTTAFLASCQLRGFCPERIFLNSRGGEVAASFMLVKAIAAIQLDTVVGKTDACLSSCFNVFAAGDVRVVFPGSVIGVHSLLEDGQETEGSRKWTMILIDALRDELHVPPGILDKIVTTPGASMTFLSYEDVQGWVEVLN